MIDRPIISIVVPCYDEEATFAHSRDALLRQIESLIAEGRISEKSYVYFVDDGSHDRTWTLIEAACTEHPGRVRALKLARNVGHQNALLAGLFAQIGKADATISLDADLQDDISIISRMIDCFTRNQTEIVFGVRASRDSDAAFKRATATWYYHTMRWLGVDIVPNHADFRLMGERALRALAEYGEVHVFLRGLVIQLGFKTEVVTFDRLPRQYGKTKYTFVKMIRLAVDGITSFSIRPLRIITVLGLLLFVMFIFMTFWVLAAWMAGIVIEGWTSLMLVFLLISSFQTLALGIIGEYVGKTYFEAKSRPRFVVEKEIS